MSAAARNDAAAALGEAKRALSNAAELMAAPPFMEGREYLYTYFGSLISGGVTGVRLSGDSTTAGDFTTSPYRISDVLKSASQRKGYRFASITNAGQSGATSNSWLNTYLAADIAAAPKLLVLRWGLNDPNPALSDEVNAATTINALATGLATLRASLSIDQTSVLVMSPNAVYDDAAGRTAKWQRLVAAGMRSVALANKCAYFDTRRLLPDATFGGWVNNDYSGAGRYVHPLNVGNLMIGSALAEALFPFGAAFDLQSVTITPTNWTQSSPSIGVLRKNNRAYLSGQLINGTANSLFGTLPVGYRPYAQLIFAVAYQPTAGTYSFCQVGINTLGEMRAYGQTGSPVAYMNLDGINFEVP
jgi:hypothetical protein